MNVRDLFFGLLVGTLFLLTLLIVRPFLTYLLAAALLAFLLWPVYRRLAPRIGPRTSAFLLITVAFVVLSIPVVLVSLALVDIAAETGAVAGGALFDRIERLAERFGVPVELPSDVTGVGEQFVRVFAGEVTQVVGATVNLVVGFSLFVFVLYYLLVDGARFVAWIRDLTPLPDEVQDELYDEANRITWAVIEGHLLVGLAQGMLGGVGLFVAGVPNAALLTLVMVLFAFVPVVGVAAVWIPAGLYLLFVERFVAGVLLLAYGATVVSWVDNYLRAFIVDRGSDLHPAVVLVGVIGGLYLMGPLGLFFGPILLALFKAALLVADEYYSL